MNESISTPFGRAIINKLGYYQITSTGEGNNGKLLHRLIYENFWSVSLPKEIVIHHKDENKLNNCINNLEAMTREEHQSLHNIGEKNPNYGKPLSEEHKKNLSLSLSGSKHPFFGKHLSEEHRKKIGLAQVGPKNHMFGKKVSLDIRKKMSESKNKTGYFRVHKESCKKCKQGYTYAYVYTDDNGKTKRFRNVDINKLEAIVKEKGLEWFKIERRN